MKPTWLGQQLSGVSGSGWSGVGCWVFKFFINEIKISMVGIGPLVFFCMFY